MTPPAGFTVATTRAEVAAALAGRSAVGAVLTMGALHDGHRALIRSARQRCDTVVVSIFLNPTQFAAGEDLDRYPRSFEGDLTACREEGADVVFAPVLDVVYPDGYPSVTVDPGQLGRILDGEFRPTHFGGVLTVVAKLLHLLGLPAASFFGEKDYQQLVLVRRMVRDLDFGVDIVGVPLLREPDGLALSSRNRNLSVADRAIAPALYRALAAGQRVAGSGELAVLEAAGAVLVAVPGLTLEYLRLTGPDLGPAPAVGPARLMVAARLGTARLIDNVAVCLGGPPCS
ncbi:MAG: pantoate--beta-alanine ligase [Mycobacteriales bacterium]|nr:MAG: pantoate--beta-alanine ligase [Pseudonocardiales bacterium]